MKESPSYYAVIPATVRYDKSLCPNAKLLYGEITALSSKQGFCWASNSYFAELFDVQQTTVSSWIKQLSDLGFIRSEIERNTKRKLFITDLTLREIPKPTIELPLREIPKPPSGNSETPPSGNSEDNNTSTNNLNKDYKLDEKPKKQRKKKVFVPPTLEEATGFFVGKNFPPELARHIAESVIAFYDARDWKVVEGKKMQKMKQWRSSFVGALDWGSTINAIKFYQQQERYANK